MLTDRRDLRVALLGPVLVEGRSGEPIEPAGALAKALVAALAGPDGRGTGRTHGIEAIADDVWGDERPANPRAALQSLVSRVRSASAAGLVVSRPGGYALGIAPEQTDLGLVGELGRRAAELARARDPHAAIAVLDDALARWRGEPGLDLGTAPIGAELADRAEARRVGLLELRARCLLDAGDAEAAVAALAPLAAAAPLDEQLHGSLITALAAAGRRTEALAAFARLRTALRDALGVSPGQHLVDLNARLLDDAPGASGGASAPEPAPAAVASPRPGPAAEQDDRPGASGTTWPDRAIEPSRAPEPGRAAEPLADGRTRLGLRAAPNRLIGRDADLAAVGTLLERHRLVTILGAGGLGKTRLAQAVAAAADAPAVIFVELAGVRDGDDIELALGSALGLREARASRLADASSRPELRARIVDRLAELPTLLVLDNCEQVIESAAAWSAELLAAAPGLRLLATSRSPLAIGAEQVYPLEPLPARLDGAAGPAARLFVERALAVRPDAALPIDAVERLCTRLDGLPLAIELAAARMRSMAVTEIEARLDDRFALLAGRDRTAPPRQRTLEAVIEWSWALLSPAERAGLARLSLFADGFGADAADAVIQTSAHGAAPATALDVLDGLVDQSLLTVRDEPLTGAVRYRMLETVREFGQLRLARDGGVETTRDAMARWAETVADVPFIGGGPDQLAALRRLRLEEENLVEILRNANAERRVPTALRLYVALAYLWNVRSAHDQVLVFGEAMLEATRHGAHDRELAAPAMLAAVFAAGTSFAYRAPATLRALARLRSHRADGWPLPPWLAATAAFIGSDSLEGAFAVLEAMSASADAPTALIGGILHCQFDENDGEPERAIEHARRAHRLAQRLGDGWAEAMSSMMLAQLASQSGDPEQALHWSAIAADGLLALDAEPDLLQLEWMRAGNLLSAGRLVEVRPLLDELAASERRTADGLALATVGELGRSELARAEGRMADARRHARVAAGSFGVHERSTPWYLMVLADLVGGAVLDGRDPGDAEWWAARIRHRTIALHRVWPEYTDKPVLGTALVGWSAWALGHPALRGRALELLALAERLHPRQDLPALRLGPHLARAERLAGAEALDRARAAAAALTQPGRAERGGGRKGAPRGAGGGAPPPGGAPGGPPRRGGGEAAPVAPPRPGGPAPALRPPGGG
ncbi:AfsR/SARP family transcriptional regulator [Agromyces soli]